IIKLLYLISMKGKYLPFLILPILFLGFLILSPVGVSARVNPDHKIDICHATSSIRNPFNRISVDKNSTAQGHDGHDGDIIPTYTYFEEVCSGRGRSRDCNLETRTYPGKNWGEAGQIVWNAGCDVPRRCVYTTVPVTGEWSEWLEEGDPIQLYRIRVISSYDLIRLELFGREVECNTEERYDACDLTETRILESEWSVDPSDETREFRVISTAEVDSTDEGVICSLEEENEYRNIEQEEEEEGDVEGITDKVETEEEEVLGTTTVVMAETGASDNILVYIVQTILMLSTLISGTLFVKKYII
ncbi:MAG: hypothetical protein PHP08_04385, partial [Candidatus Dojkabacteria bacterium]|nr:hypothetical protein [Candidatus Dojkabacteria bacterium]